MIDFAKHLSGGPPSDEKVSFLDTFRRLERAPTHVELRQPQWEALERLQEIRDRSCQVLRFGTGSGKTLVGLVYLETFRRALKKPVAFLCANNQLVEQTLAEAKRIGVDASPFLAGEQFPAADTVSGDAVLVCTYDKLFSGMSRFNHRDVDLRPAAFVLDDVHVGADIVRNCHTIVLKKALYLAARQVLSGAGNETNKAEWERIMADDPRVVVELPYWRWHSVLAEVRQILDTKGDEKNDHKFATKLIREHLHLCRCVVSGNRIEIFPQLPLVNKNRAYHQAPHKLFMSATLPDYGCLIRDLGCSLEAARAPVVPSGGEIGERMVIAPSLIDPTLSRDVVLKWISTAPNAGVSVVALCSSREQQKDWAAVGAETPIGNEVLGVVERLKAAATPKKFAALAQRYEGVDLPEEACRVLILDGTPRGQNTYELLDAYVEGTPGGKDARSALRLEQGMGRAVRSSVDHCVVLLAGDDIATFVSRAEVLALMSATTRAQLELARELAKIAKEDGAASGAVLLDLVKKCLDRDLGWRQFYRKRIENKGAETPVTATELVLAAALRTAFDRAAGKSMREAVDVLTALLNNGGGLSEHQKGWVLQLKGLLTHSFDAGEAMVCQVGAFARNDTLLAPPDESVCRPGTPSKSAGRNLCAWYGQFNDPAGALAAFQNIAVRLAYSAKEDTFVQALEDVAPLLGAQGERPEKKYGRGPDVLWRWPEIDWVVEAKNEKTNLQVTKDDGEQLMSALAWHTSRCPDRARHGVLVADSTDLTWQAYFPEGSSILTQQGLEGLKEAARQVVSRLVQKPAWTEGEAASLLQDAKVMPASLVRVLQKAKGK